MDKSSNRILVFTTAFRPLVGGSEIAIEEIIRHLPATFFDVITPKLRGSLASRECGDNYCVHRLGWGWIGDKIFFPLTGYRLAARLMAKNRYDFIHVFQASYAGGAAWLLKLFYPAIPMILTLQEGKDLDKQSGFIKFCRKLIIKKANRISAISEYLKKYVLKIRRGIPVKLIPNGVDIDNFSRDLSYGELSALKDRFGIKPDEKVVISVSRLVPKNGLDDLIGAAAILNKKMKGQAVRLLLVGGGNLRGTLADLAEGLKINEKIIFAGEANHLDLAKYLKISDVFVRPSLSEGMGSAFLEAMAAGVPVIGTPVGGIPDFLKDRETGLFCEVSNPADLAEKIRLILEDNALRADLIKNAGKLVIENYDWKKIAKDYESLIYYK